MKIKKIFRSWRIPLSCGLFVILIFQYVLLIGYVPSGSMEPTIPKGSYVLGLRILGEPQRGDIVMFRLDDRILVKRIAAIPSDIVYTDKSESEVSISDITNNTGTILAVPDGCYYMLGDNPKESRDSRYWKDPFIRREDILAKLLLP